MTPPCPNQPRSSAALVILLAAFAGSSACAKAAPGPSTPPTAAAHVNEATDFSTLVTSAAHDDPAVRRDAMNTLAVLVAHNRFMGPWRALADEDRRHALTIFIANARHEDVGLRETSMLALAAFAGLGVLDRMSLQLSDADLETFAAALVANLGADAPALRAGATRALGRIAHRSGDQLLLLWSALSEAQRPSLATRWVKSAYDPEPSVRTAGLQAMEELAGSSARGSSRVVLDQVWSVIPSPEQGAFAASLVDSVEHRDPKVRGAAWRAFSALMTRGYAGLVWEPLSSADRRRLAIALVVSASHADEERRREGLAVVTSLVRSDYYTGSDHLGAVWGRPSGRGAPDARGLAGEGRDRP